jgi:acyl-CoA synthetase (AMP-forming)/AMP-acid ligase II
MDHPAEQQVVTFAMPCDNLGKEVAAVAILRKGKEADKAAIRNFAATRLVGCKVPRRVIILPEIPKGPQASCNASVWRKSWPSRANNSPVPKYPRRRLPS